MEWALKCILCYTALLMNTDPVIVKLISVEKRKSPTLHLMNTQQTPASLRSAVRESKEIQENPGTLESGGIQVQLASKVMLECMEMMDSLKKVCLENNNIGDTGAVALSKALEDNDTLLSIHLESNEISREGACSLGEMLSNKFKLSKLNLNNNPIGDEGFSKIAEGLAEIETLRIITLANTDITKASIPSLSQSL